MTPEQAGVLRAITEALVEACQDRDASPKSNLAVKSYSTALCRAELYLSNLDLLDEIRAKGPLEHSPPSADPVGFVGDTVDLSEYDDTNVIPLTFRGLMQ